MTKKDFIPLAQLVVDLYSKEFNNEPFEASYIESKIIKILEADNSNFNLDKWESFISKLVIETQKQDTKNIK